MGPISGFVGRYLTFSSLLITWLCIKIQNQLFNFLRIEVSKHIYEALQKQVNFIGMNFKNHLDNQWKFGAISNTYTITRNPFMLDYAQYRMDDVWTRSIVLLSDCSPSLNIVSTTTHIYLASCHQMPYLLTYLDGNLFIFPTYIIT